MWLHLLHWWGEGCYINSKFMSRVWSLFIVLALPSINHSHITHPFPTRRIYKNCLRILKESPALSHHSAFSDCSRSATLAFSSLHSLKYFLILLPTFPSDCVDPYTVGLMSMECSLQISLLTFQCLSIDSFLQEPFGSETDSGSLC